MYAEAIGSPAVGGRDPRPRGSRTPLRGSWVESSLGLRCVWSPRGDFGPGRESDPSSQAAAAAGAHLLTGPIGSTVRPYTSLSTRAMPVYIAESPQTIPS